ncbi:MAG: hypothetical protein Q8L45_03425 [Xanthomonadaceae bacterium]|nr:hypothetical protein [Xanthomonadaceae bacterium]MDP2186655.1 hypothetical protein [Xanthomonadales bacterium]MDZ4114517.1 hypothetical protein [Xanthomonadaceae bacterium]MDZ4378969.1 hypothetical protein [Xanthomonadaceae bacterium]
MNKNRRQRSRFGLVRLSRLITLSLILLVSAQTTNAESLYKCHGMDDVVSYQSAPCAQSAQQIWQREVTPEPQPRVAAQRTPAQRPAPARSRAVRVRAANAAAPRANACARARAAADDERDRDWYTITFDRLRQLDAMVARACKKS